MKKGKYTSTHTTEEESKSTDCARKAIEMPLTAESSRFCRIDKVHFFGALLSTSQCENAQVAVVEQKGSKRSSPEYVVTSDSQDVHYHAMVRRN